MSTVVGIERCLFCKREEVEGIISAYRVSVSRKVSRIREKQTNIIYISKLNSCVPTSMIALISRARLGR